MLRGVSWFASPVTSFAFWYEAICVSSSESVLRVTCRGELPRSVVLGMRNQKSRQFWEGEKEQMQGGRTKLWQRQG